MALCPRLARWRILGHSRDIRSGLLQGRQHCLNTGCEQVSLGNLKVYEFRGGPLDGQQRAIANRYGGTLPPHIFECRVQEPLTVAESYAAYVAAHPVDEKTPPKHRYYYAIEHDCYKYLGTA